MNNIAKGKNIIKTYKIDNTKGHEELGIIGLLSMDTFPNQMKYQKS